MPIPIEVILGSGGLAAFAIWIVNELWKSHKASDADVRDQRDKAVARLDAFLNKVERPKDPQP